MPKCQSCGRLNRAEAHFCDACGARIRPITGASGERRQLTALFCDIVDYTRLARLLDEEELHKVVGTYQTRVVDVVTRWGGFVESAVGDAVTAFFGFPQAHEDDAERAVRAGLEIMSVVGLAAPDAISAADARALKLVVRIGIHTGVVVVGDLGTGEPGKRQALGPTLNVAARLQAIAHPGTVVISDACERLVAGLFLTQDLGLLPLKGIEEPVHSYVVQSPSGGRFETHSSRAVPLIGRQRELAELRAHWERACGGHGQVVLLSGEAGIGKSRIVRRLREDIVDAGEGLAFEWRCSPFYTARPFHPIIEGLTRHLGITGGTPRERLFGAVQTFLSGSGLPFDGELTLPAATSLLADLIAPGTSTGIDRETPTLRRLRTLDLLCSLTSARARDQASVMVMEDLHWADPSTIELLGLLASRCSDVPLLLVFTFRPDFVPPWPGAAVHTLNLEPLNSEQCAELFDAIVGVRVLPPRVREEVLSKGEGVPLFVEELIQTVLATTTDHMTIVSATPNNLRSLIVSRIDRLSEGGAETVHLASALSREFGFDLLATVSERSGAALRNDLDELVGSGLLFRRQTPAAEHFVFKHALIAEYAYDSILHSDRRRLHARIARRLRDAFPAMAVEQPEFLAHHFGEGGEAETAIEYWKQAGDAAVARGAFREALNHFENGRSQLAHVRDSRVRLHHEIELTASRGTALFSILGYAHPEVESTFAHASALCDQEGSSPGLMVLYGLWAVHVTRNNREPLRGMLPRFQEFARSGDPNSVLLAHANAGVYAFFSGEFELGEAELTEATRWYTTADQLAFVRRYGYAGGLYPFAYQAWARLILGRSQDAQGAAEQLQRLADELGYPYGLAIAGGFLVNLARDRRNATEALALADRQLEYIQRQMLGLWEGPARCGRGWALAVLGNTEDGIAEIRKGLNHCDLVGLRATYPYHLGGLAEALLLSGDANGALTAATEALSICESGLDRFYESELRRYCGEAQWRLGDLASAESTLNDALAVAVRQAATLFAVRAVVSLARLMIESGRPEVARVKLEEVLPAVVGGSDLMEVEEARDLLSAFT